MVGDIRMDPKRIGINIKRAICLFGHGNYSVEFPCTISVSC